MCFDKIAGIRSKGRTGGLIYTDRVYTEGVMAGKSLSRHRIIESIGLNDCKRVQGSRDNGVCRKRGRRCWVDGRDQRTKGFAASEFRERIRGVAIEEVVVV